MSDVYLSIKETFAKPHDLEVVLQGGEIQAVSKEVIRMASLINDMSSLMAQCKYDTYVIHQK